MTSNQDKIQLWLQNEVLTGRKSAYDELTDTEANILVQRFATDVDQVKSDCSHSEISIEKLPFTHGYKLRVETAAGIELRFRPTMKR